MGETKKILLFAGTTEGRELCGWLAGQSCQVTACTATEYGGELLRQETDGRDNVHICQGRLDEAQMEQLFEEFKPGLVVDATHPYAVLVTENLKKACAAYGKAGYLRCLRPESAGKTEEIAGQRLLYFDTMEQAAEWLKDKVGNVLVTTSKELAIFNCIEDNRERIYARVLPLEASVRICRELGYEGNHIIGMQGPFSEKMNQVQLEEYNCRYLVTKDGGKAGGFWEKLSAAKKAGAEVLVIRRPQDKGYGPEEIKTQIKEWLDNEEGS